MKYKSSHMIDSTVSPGVSFQIRKMSFGCRIGLMCEVHELSKQIGYALASDGESQRPAESALLNADLQRLYLRHGLLGVKGIEIDGEAPSVEGFLDSGPEALVAEALQHVLAEFELPDEKRKNSWSHSTSI